MRESLWYLVADIGGTNARFALAHAHSGRLELVRKYRVADFESFAGVLAHFIAEMGPEVDVRGACIAVASLVEGDILHLTNNRWTMDRHYIARCLGGAPVVLINDFVAIGHAVAALDPGQWHQIGGGDGVAGWPCAVLGAGTGLGTCTLVPAADGDRVLEGEGGHVDFAPCNDREIDVLRLLLKKYPRVSVERLLSGSGILNIYQALATLAGREAVHAEPEAISEQALAEPASLAAEALAMFCAIFGSVAGNMALTVGARGGVYIAGGIAPRIIDFLAASQFRARFEDKGRFRAYVRNIPVRVLLADNLGLIGATRCLQRANNQGIQDGK
ncbi:MAG: glucokinase [Porticoccaceae bacterium]